MNNPANSSILNLRRRRRLRTPACFTRRYFFLWALPLLRTCLTKTTTIRRTSNNPLGLLQSYTSYLVRPNAAILCDAFSPATTTTTTSRNLSRTSSFLAPFRFEHETPTKPSFFSSPSKASIPMARSSALRSSRRKASTKPEGLPDDSTSSATASPSLSSSSRKRSLDSAKDSSKDWSSLTVAALKDELTKRGLKTTGLKADLVALLDRDDRGEDVSAMKSSPKAKRTKTPPPSPVPKKKKTAAKPTSPKKKPGSPTRKKAADHQRITDVDELPKLWNEDMAKANGSYTFKIASWNVAGLRALIRKEPDAMAKMCEKHDLDMLCLQETKLQEMHLEDPKLKLKGLLEEAGYDEHWSCSTAKKGYSGTAIFVKRRGKQKDSSSNKSKGKQATIGSFFAPKKKGSSAKEESISKMDQKTLPFGPEMLIPTSVGFSVGKEIDNEGRVVFLEFPWATIANVYVPNSGQKLERLDYRTKEWDEFFLKFMQEKQTKSGLPVIWLGDLNIAHRAYDIWNDGAKHLAKQSGVTVQERESFTKQLDAGFVDVFRKLHPTAKGNYSYWSQRAGSREPNKGLRLDYFIASKDMFDEDSSRVIPRDSYMIMDQLGSDHSPVVLELEIKGSTA